MSKTKPVLPLPLISAAPLAPDTIYKAAFNISDDTFILGDRKFELRDLSYDSYVLFLGFLTPLLEVVVQKIAGGAGVTIPGIDLNATSFGSDNILRLCSDSLPKMVLLMCQESDPEITVEEVKHLAGKPTVLVTAVIRQVHKNQMIQDFADFFKQVLSVVKPLTPALSQSTFQTEETL